MFDKYSSKYLQEKKTIEQLLASFGNQVSNLEKSLDAAFGYAGTLNTIWDTAVYIQKQQLQKLIFPERMFYNKKRIYVEPEK